MNRRGHPETLVARQVGNQNALKAGVFSPEALAARVQEVDAAIAERPVGEVLTDVLRREVASLAVLGEAMDQTLANDGVIGRRGEPRRMIELRLRLNEKLRRTLERYDQTVQAQPALAREGTDATPAEEPVRQRLAQTIVAYHGRTPEETLTPSDFDPEVFLHAVVVTDDPRTRPPDRVRAQRMLTRRRLNRPSTCVCISTLRARDEIELREWVLEIRQTGVEPAHNDRELAAIVRAVALGESRDPLIPYAAYRRTEQAVRDVLGEAEAEASADAGEPDTAPPRRREDPAADRFWLTLLAPDPNVKTKDRLDAFMVLDEMNALPRCTCEQDPTLQLWELEADATRGYVIRMVAQQHYRAAMVIARFPETYLAIRDAIDEVRLRAVRALGHAANRSAPAA